jgi:signal transduction histidine kinase
LREFFGRFSRASIVLVCAGFSIFVLVLCVWGGLQFKRSTEQEFYRETENIAQILLASFEDDATGLDSILTRLAADIRESDVSLSNETELHRLLARYSLQAAVIGPGVVDRNGTLIASARVDPVPRVSLKDRTTFRIHADNPDRYQLYISAPTRGLLTNEWAIQFSRPLRDNTGTFLGVVLASYRLSHFIELYEKLKLSDRGLAGLTGKDAIVRIRTLSGEIGYGSQIPPMPLVYDRVIAGEMIGNFYGRGSVDDVTRIGTFVVSPTMPFYVTVGYDESYLRSQYIGFYYVLGLCWLALTVAMIASAVLIRSLEQTRQRTQIEVVNSAIAERQKISADMHDSIGASLATLLAHFVTGPVNMADVKRRIGEVLMELRFLVDSADPVDGDFNLVLSNVRHRMGTGIELAGIALHWQVSELPIIPGLTARDALSIKLVLMEALSNILHHSKAKTTTLTARYDEQASRVVITVQDDGRGFDAGDAASAGRGITNMRRRIRAVSIGGTLVIDSAPGRGTTVEIELMVPKGEAGTAPRRDSAA